MLQFIMLAVNTPVPCQPWWCVPEKHYSSHDQGLMMMMIAMQTAVIRRQIGKSLPLFFSAKILV
jgi:hypothetical protein